MSEPLRIAAAVEGPTDAIVLQAILRALLPDTDFKFRMLQPEGSDAFDSAQSSSTGVGWVGVYRWSRQLLREGGGSVSGSSALSFHDVLIVHVDADVAGRKYTDGSIRDAPCADLPCENPVRRRIKLPTPCERWFSIGLVSMNVRHGLSCARLRRASKPGCLPLSGRKTTWFSETIGSATATRNASSQPCPNPGGSRNTRMTINVSKVR